MTLTKGNPNKIAKQGLIYLLLILHGFSSLGSVLVHLNASGNLKINKQHTLNAER